PAPYTPRSRSQGGRLCRRSRAGGWTQRRTHRGGRYARTGGEKPGQLHRPVPEEGAKVQGPEQGQNGTWIIGRELSSCDKQAPDAFRYPTVYFRGNLLCSGHLPGDQG